MDTLISKWLNIIDFNVVLLELVEANVKDVNKFILLFRLNQIELFVRDPPRANATPLKIYVFGKNSLYIARTFKPILQIPI